MSQSILSRIKERRANREMQEQSSPEATDTPASPTLPALPESPTLTRSSQLSPGPISAELSPLQRGLEEFFKRSAPDLLAKAEKQEMDPKMKALLPLLKMGVQRFPTGLITSQPAEALHKNVLLGVLLMQRLLEEDKAYGIGLGEGTPTIPLLEDDSSRGIGIGQDDAGRADGHVASPETAEDAMFVYRQQAEI